MKKILIFSLVYFPLPNGGAEPAIKEITDRIDEKEIEFHMITCLWDSKLPRVEKVGKIIVHRIGFGIAEPRTEDFKANKKLNFNKYYFQAFAGIKAIQLHLKYNYFACWAMMAHSCGIPASIFKTFAPKVKYILSLQEGDPVEHVERIAHTIPFISWWLFKRGFTKADIIQSISYYLQNWANKLAPSVPKILIKNGANPNDLNDKFSQTQIDDFKIKIGKKMGEIFLVNTSRVVHQKGIDTTIEALQYLPDHIKFLVVGDGDRMEEYKQLAEKIKVSDRVIFTGRVDRNIVTLYRKISDIFVGASRTEGLGNAFVSALASRLPLITTGVGGIADYAFDGKTAWLVPVENPKAIADKVLEIINNPGQVKEISDNARKMVEEDYDWDKIAVKMKEEVFN